MESLSIRSRRDHCLAESLQSTMTPGKVHGSRSKSNCDSRHPILQIAADLIAID